MSLQDYQIKDSGNEGQSVLQSQQKALSKNPYRPSSTTLFILATAIILKTDSNMCSLHY